MDEKHRNILVIAIAVTVLAAVLVSFGLPSLTGPVPEVKLPEVSQQQPVGEDGLLPVSVGPDNVQAVIETLARPESYYRELTVTLSWQGGSAADQIQVWADGGYVKTISTASGSVQHRLVADGSVYLWYAGDRTWQQFPAAAESGDLAQRVPTYEEVLALDPASIVAAGYERRNDRDCVYVEAEDALLGTRDCYWIETATGLLYAAETYAGDRVVYAMTESACTIPLDAGIAFALPDGTVLHESGAG